MDPVVGAGVAKAAMSAVDDSSKTAHGLLERALGPTADLIGAALASYTELRWANTERIAEKAEKKSRAHNRTGPANPRVAHKVLEEGSYADDELMAEYFSGLLAASRTPEGRDDRAVVWTNIVGSLSSVQVRLHFGLYSEWARQLLGRTELNLGMDHGRKLAAAEIVLAEGLLLVDPAAIVRVGTTIVVPPEGVRKFEHAAIGLVREGLIGPQYGWGTREAVGRPESQYEQLFWTQPTAVGMELFGWAVGRDGLTPREFCELAELPETPDDVGSLPSFVMPKQVAGDGQPKAETPDQSHAKPDEPPTS